MNTHEPFLDRTLMPEPSAREIDTLLRDYFRKQMPNPWPKAPVTKQKTRPAPHTLRPARPWIRARRYLALAAALALFVLGYSALSAVFPNFVPGPLQLNPEHEIVKDLPTPNVDAIPSPKGLPFNIDPKRQGQHNAPKILQTPNGEIRVYEEQVNGKTFMRLEALPKLKSGSGQ